MAVPEMADVLICKVFFTAPDQAVAWRGLKSRQSRQNCRHVPTVLMAHSAFILNL
jgi:hypothetical protein